MVCLITLNNRKRIPFVAYELCDVRVILRMALHKFSIHLMLKTGTVLKFFEQFI